MIINLPKRTANKRLLHFYYIIIKKTLVIFISIKKHEVRHVWFISNHRQRKTQMMLFKQKCDWWSSHHLTVNEKHNCYSDRKINTNTTMCMTQENAAEYKGRLCIRCDIITVYFLFLFASCGSELTESRRANRSTDDRSPSHRTERWQNITRHSDLNTFNYTWFWFIWKCIVIVLW